MPEQQLGTLLVSCPDQKGIVATLAQLLYSHGANIVDADQHTDPIAAMFFQRIRFDLATAQTDRARLEALPRRGPRAVRARVAPRPRVRAAAAARRRVLLQAGALPLRPAHPLPRRRAAVRDRDGDLESRRRSSRSRGTSTSRFITCRSPRRPSAQQEAAALALLEARRRRADRARALHADPVARVRRALPVADHQRPSLVPAGVHRREPVPPGLREGRQADRRDQPLRDGRARSGADHRAGGRSAARTAITSKTSCAKAATSRSARSRAPCAASRGSLLVYSEKTVVFE